MSGSSRMQDLFAAAREDAPADHVRDQVWGRVVTATAAPAGAAAALKAAVVPSGGKLVAFGAILGAVGAGFVALALVSLDADAPRSPAASARAPAVVATGALAGARLSEPAPRRRAASAPEPASAATAARTPNVASAGADASGATAGAVTSSAGAVTRGAGAPREDASGLSEEARLVTEARAALVRGEPDVALALARSTRRLAARALEPEELALEARALRALGRTDEALATELTLRRRFPSHALSR